MWVWANLAEISTRALREIYLRPFELAIRDVDSAPWAVMTAYNRVNGKYSSYSACALDAYVVKQ